MTSTISRFFLSLLLLVGVTACPDAGTGAAALAASPGGGRGAAAVVPQSGPGSACPVPVCRYEGTSWAEDQVGDELFDRGEARVSWRFSHMSGREAVYAPAGTMSAAWRTDACAITLAPASHAFTADAASVRHARLHVDFTTRPVRYHGTGAGEWVGTQTWTCRGSAPFEQDGVTTTWFRVDAATSDDPGLLRGSFTSGTTRSNWEFVNSP